MHVLLIKKFMLEIYFQNIHTCDTFVKETSFESTHFPLFDDIKSENMHV